MKLNYKIVSVLLIFFASCHQEVKQEKSTQVKNAIDSDNEIKVFPLNGFTFDLDSLEENKTKFSQLRKLPPLDSRLLKQFRSLTDDNMISEEPGYLSSFHNLRQFKIGNNNAIAILRLTDLNSKSGLITVAVLDKNDQIIALAKLAEYFDEAGGTINYKSKLLNNNEFLTSYNLSDVEVSDPDAEGVSEINGRYYISKTKKLKFVDSVFKSELIDSTYRLQR